jgi:hypothetical protein
VENTGWVGCVTTSFSEEFKTYQVNAFHLNSNRKFSNNMVGCISWHAYFLGGLGWFCFSKRFKFDFEISFRNILKALRLKPGFKFEYLNQIPNP